MTAIGQLNNPVLQKARDWFATRGDIPLALVFGSFAKGQATERSDVDIAVAGTRPLSADQKVELIDELSRLLGREIDCVDLNSATGTVLQEAVGQGVILKNEDPALFARVLSRMWTDYEDFEKQRQRILAERRKKAFGG